MAYREAPTVVENVRLPLLDIRNERNHGLRSWYPDVAHKRKVTWGLAILDPG